MVKLRNALLMLALATGGAGCATFCDECDDFPVPGGPGGYHLMPGSYAGPPIESAPGPGAAGGAPTLTPPTGAAAPASGAGATTPPAGDSAPTPPPAPPADAPR